MRVSPLLLPVVVGLMGCGGSSAGGTDFPETGMRVTVETDRDVYAPGDTVFLDLRVVNPGAAPATLRFASGQRYEFTILDAAGESVWTWSADKGFIQALGDERIEPGAMLTFREMFTGGLPPGRYAVRGLVPALDGVLADTTSIEVR